jgi:Domain of unknown function (DUF1707)
MGKAADIRISDTEREEAVSALGEHLSSGRLELTEYEERCGRAVAARTRGELEALFTDLPAPHPDLSSAAPPGTLFQRAGQLAVRPGSSAHKQPTETPASKALEVVAALALVIGIPGAILLTIFAGLWWLFIPVGVILFGAAGAADYCKVDR